MREAECGEHVVRIRILEQEAERHLRRVKSLEQQLAEVEQAAGERTNQLLQERRQERERDTPGTRPLSSSSSTASTAGRECTRIGSQDSRDRWGQ